MIEFATAFALGILSVLSPCVLPVVPLIFAASRGSAANALLIMFGLLLNMLVIGIISGTISLTSFRFLAYAFMAFFALTLISDTLRAKFTAAISLASNRVALINRGSSLIFGFILAFVWLPCIAPFMGIAVSQALLSDPETAPFIMLFYGAGMSAAMVAVLGFGSKIIEKVGVHGEKLSKVAGFVVILYLIYFVVVT